MLHNVDSITYFLSNNSLIGCSLCNNYLIGDFLFEDELKKYHRSELNYSKKFSSFPRYIYTTEEKNLLSKKFLEEEKIYFSKKKKLLSMKKILEQGKNFLRKKKNSSARKKNFEQEKKLDK